MLETDKKIIGAKFREYRKYKKLTQFQLAELVGLNEKQISRIEMGQNYPTYTTFAKLIEVLDINISEFLKNEKIETNKEQEKLLRLIKNLSCAETSVCLDLIKSLKKNIQNT